MGAAAGEDGQKRLGMHEGAFASRSPAKGLLAASVRGRDAVVSSALRGLFALAVRLVAAGWSLRSAALFSVRSRVPPGRSLSAVCLSFLEKTHEGKTHVFGGAPNPTHPT